MLRLKNSWNRFLKSEIWSTNVFQQSTFGFNVGRRFVAKWGSWGRFKFDTRFNFGRIRKGLEEIWDELKVMSWHKTWREIRLQDQDFSEKRFESRVFFLLWVRIFWMNQKTIDESLKGGLDDLPFNRKQLLMNHLKLSKASLQFSTHN